MSVLERQSPRELERRLQFRPLLENDAGVELVEPVGSKLTLMILFAIDEQVGADGHPVRALNTEQTLYALTVAIAPDADTRRDGSAEQIAVAEICTSTRRVL